MLPLHILECPSAAPDGGGRRRSLEALPELVETGHGSGRQDDGGLEDVSRLADIVRQS